MNNVVSLYSIKFLRVSNKIFLNLFQKFHFFFYIKIDNTTSSIRNLRKKRWILAPPQYLSFFSLEARSRNSPLLLRDDCLSARNAGCTVWTCIVSRGRRRCRRRWMGVHPWWRLLEDIVPHLLGYELASSFDLPVISLRLLLPRLLRPSSCHSTVAAGNTFLPPSIPASSPLQAGHRLLSSLRTYTLSFSPSPPPFGLAPSSFRTKDIAGRNVLF